MSVAHHPLLSRSTSRPLHVAVVGCGRIAEVYHLPAIAANRERCGRLTLIDPSQDRARELAEQFTADDIQTNYNAVLGDLDAAIVATPHSSHFSITSDLLAHGVHVLCEKPLVESADEARQLVALAREHDVALCVNQTRRLFPAYAKIREIIRGQRIGEIRQLEFADCNRFSWPTASGFYFQKKSPKGVLLDKGIHVLDTICWWLGETPVVVDSLTDALAGIETVAKAEFAAGPTQIRVHVSWLTKSQSGYRIEGETGTIEGGIEDWREVVIRHHGGRVERIKCTSRGRTFESYNDFGTAMVENFLEVAAGTATPSVPAHDVIPALELMEACYDQARRFETPWFETGTISAPALSSVPREASELPPESAAERRILVTGAGGFLAPGCVRWCRGAISGWSWAAYASGPVRSASRAGTPAVACDIMCPSEVRAAFRDVTDIVHCAYVDDREVIVEGTRNVLEAAVEADVRRFVFLSTAEVYGPNVSGSLDETTPLSESGSLYADAKIEAEHLCWEYADRGLPVTVLRPSIVYGPFSDSKTTRLAKRLRSGNWGTFSEFGDGQCNLVYVDDLVRAICLCIACDASVGQAYHVNGPDNVTWNEYFATFNQVLALPPLAAVSPKSSRLRAATTDSMRKLTGLMLRPFGDQIMAFYLRGGAIPRMMKRFKDFLGSQPSTTELTTLYNRQAIYNDDKIKHHVGYRPQIDLERGLTLCVQWLDHHEI